MDDTPTPIDICEQEATNAVESIIKCVLGNDFKNISKQIENLESDLEDYLPEDEWIDKISSGYNDVKNNIVKINESLNVIMNKINTLEDNMVSNENIVNVIADKINTLEDNMASNEKIVNVTAKKIDRLKGKISTATFILSSGFIILIFLHLISVYF